LIYCLLSRAWRICSDLEAKNLEIKRIKSILLGNDYPAHVLVSEISKFVRNVTKQEAASVSHSGDEQPEDDSKKKKKRYIKLPYVNNKVEDFGKKLTKLVNSNFPLVELRVAFVAPMEIGKLFKFKDKVIEVEKQFLVVYHVKCKDCGADYIGKTERILSRRLKEHKESKSSTLFQHAASTGHEIDYDNVEILDRADSDRKLQVKEILHIDKRNPTLNIQLNNQAAFRMNVKIIGSKKKEP
jgi:GIY-YIG catalytic domain-containing protein